jgi:iron complex outermembrane recepter protein
MSTGNLSIILQIVTECLILIFLVISELNYTINSPWFGEVGINLLVGNIFNAKFETNAWIYRYIEQGEEQYMDGFFPQAGRHFFTGFSIKF